MSSQCFFPLFDLLFRFYLLFLWFFFCCCSSLFRNTKVKTDNTIKIVRTHYEKKEEENGKFMVCATWHTMLQSHPFDFAHDFYIY